MSLFSGAALAQVNWDSAAWDDAVWGLVDSDDDGVDDANDPFPNDPTEWEDSDGDGVGNNGDAFPDDANESKDSDGDGVGDNSDAFPDDPKESYDSDGDGIGDNSDIFPDDSTEWSDSDGDGIGDNADPDDDNDGIPDGYTGPIEAIKNCPQGIQKCRNPHSLDWITTITPQCINQEPPAVKTTALTPCL